MNFSISYRSGREEDVRLWIDMPLVDSFCEECRRFF